MVTYGLKEVFSQGKFSGDSTSPAGLPIVVSPTKVYYFEHGDGSENADTRIIKCTKDTSSGTWSCSSVYSDTGGWWISILHILLRDKEYILGAWANVPNPKLWVVNSGVSAYTYGSSNMENLGHTIYLADYDMLLSGGECSGNKIRLIDPTDWSEKASWTFSWLSGQNYGKIDIVPRNDNKLYVLGGIGTASSNPHNAILGTVDIDDLMSNQGTNIDSLSSWTQIKDFAEYPQCNIIFGYHARWIVVSLHDSGNIIYDPINDKTIYSGNAHFKFGDGSFGVYDSSSGTLTLYDKTGTQLAQITGLSYGGIGQNNDAVLFGMGFNSDETTNYLLALTFNGYTPIPEIDFANNQFRIIDFHTLSEIPFKVMVVWSKAGNGFVSPIIVDDSKTATLNVNSWTEIPSPPSTGNWLMSIIPLEPLG